MIRNFAFVLCLLTLSMSAAHANPMPLGTPLTSGTSTQFNFGAVGSPSDNNPFFFSGSGVVTVLDAYADGDQFSVYDNSIYLGTTSMPVNDESNCGGNFADCYANLSFSRANYSLGTGNHSITIFTTMSPYGGGGALIGLGLEPADASPVPEPSSIIMLGTGLCAAAGAIRRKIKR
jgi:hypothetical protein